jgi:ABC-type branched-subunit amino acid transport system substrate-binding protein/tRNA A-37 threonylcarbamoyl transferase component Bud32
MSVGAELPVGSELLGYRVEVVLGRGGMGIVYLAEDLRLKRKVALKLLSPELAEDERFRERLLAESELAASLDHPNIVPIYQAGEADGRIFISMRYVEGEDLKKALRNGPLSPEYSLVVTSQVASALDAAHARGLVHRDVKPSNVLLAPAAGHEGADHVYLADFGLTQRLVQQELSPDHGPLMGTIDYVAPEQIRGEAVDGRADVYSLGCLLFECLAGAPPFRHKSDVALLFAHMREEPPSLTALRPELPRGIDSVITKALAKDPEARYGTCRQLVEGAREALPAPGLTRRRRIRRRRLLVASALLAAAAGLAVGLVLSWGGGASSARISIGMVAAKTGGASLFDLPAGQAFMLRIGEINKAGGLLGKKIDVDWVDTKSFEQLPGTRTVKFEPGPTTNELISKGAAVIVGGCQFSWARPVLAASRDRSVPALSLCGDTYRAAAPGVVGPYAGAMAGADGEATSMAEWLRKQRPRWKRAYVLEDTTADTGGEYPKQAAKYFLVRWLELGGNISGEDTFHLGSALPLSSQLTRLRAKLGQTDLIYVPTYRDGGAAILQIRGAGIELPIATTSMVEGIPLGVGAGNPSNVFALGAACLPSYCAGATPQVGRFFANFKKRYGSVPTGDAVRGYDLATVLVAAIRKANSTDGPKIAQALFSGLTIETLTGRVKFSEQCHRPQPPRYILERYTNGRATALGRVYARRIPTIGDGNPCAGVQARPLR